MKRYRPPILRSLLSVALLAACAGWVRSRWTSDSLTWTDSRRFVSLTSSGGRLNLTEQLWENGTAATAGWTAQSMSRRKTPPYWENPNAVGNRRRWLGFEWCEALWFTPSYGHLIASFYVPPLRLIAVPYWFVCTLLSLPLVRALIVAQRRRRRVARQLCPDCGYDMRASPGRCPECGSSEAAPWTPSTQPAVS